MILTLCNSYKLIIYYLLHNYLLDGFHENILIGFKPI